MQVKMRTRGGKVGSNSTFGRTSKPLRVTLPHIPSSTFGEPSPISSNSPIVNRSSQSSIQPPLQTPALPTIVQDPSSQPHCPSPHEQNESQPHPSSPNGQSLSGASSINPIDARKLIKPDGDT